MKRLLSVLIVLMMVLNYAPVFSGAVELFDSEVGTINILEESTERKVIIASGKAISDLTVYVAAFKDDAMIGAVSKTVSLVVGNNIIDVEPTWSVEERDFVKIFLWDKNLKPCAEKVVAKTPVIFVETVYADVRNETVEVEISILNNPGISSLKFDVDYDNDLTLTNVELSEAFGAYLTAAQPFTNPQPISLITPFEDVNVSGVLATLTFDMSDVPAEKKYADVNVVCDGENIFDADFEFVEFEEVNGKIIFDETITLSEYMQEDEFSLMEAKGLTLTVEEVTGMPGDSVEVDLTLSNNPGIASLMFDVEYDEVLTLESVSFNSDFGLYATAAQPFTNPQPISFISPFNNVNVNGTFATLKFKIADSAEDKYVADINVTYSEDDVFDSNYNYVDMSVVNGNVTVYEGLPGDINADGKVTNMDAIIHFRYVAKWPVTVDEEALDVTGDGKINNVDAIQLFRFVAKWPGIVLLRGKACEHTLESFAEVKATCTESGNVAYWHCTKCDRYYSDAKASNVIKIEDTVVEAKGHTIVSIPAVAPTYTETGLTEGKKCSVCDLEILKQETIPVLQKDEYFIQYMCDMVPIGPDEKPITYAPDTYKPTQTKVLPTPKMDKYEFLGWSDQNGVMYGTEIPKGTTDDLILYANWVSNRNRAVKKSELSDPIILEDSAKGILMFAYEIGTIENVPLYTTLDLQCADGIITTIGVSEQEEISENNAIEVAEIISNATTNTTSWTLSNDWEKTTEKGNEISKSQSESNEEYSSRINSSIFTQSESNSAGGASSYINTNSSSYNISANQAHRTDWGVDTESNYEYTTDDKLNTNIGAEVSAGWGPISAKVEAGISTESSVHTESSNKISTTNSGTDSWDTHMSSNQTNTNSSTNSKTWNTTASSSISDGITDEERYSTILSNEIAERYNYGESFAEGGSRSDSAEFALNKTTSEGRTSTVAYHTARIETKTREFKSTGNTFGNYRMVQAGTMHVFAVVRYDVSTGEYFTYTHNVLDDKTHEYLDYSYNGKFNDYETSVIPFEIPYYVNDYVNNRIYRTEGLKLNPTTGMIVGYEPLDKENPDNIVIIPSYWQFDNNDGTFSSIKITGIAPHLFENNKNITAVKLGKFITEIPESTFNGCSNLQYVMAPSITSIGNDAFADCTSLKEFKISTDITSIGTDAFKNAPTLTAVAATANIAQAVAKSGAKNIVLDISEIPEAENSGIRIEVGEIDSFKIIGKSKEYKDLRVKSDAKTTTINGVTITDNTEIPIELSSGNVILDNVGVNCNGYAMVLKATETNISLNKEVNLISNDEDAVIAKTINLSELNSSYVGNLNLTGNLLTCGSVNDNGLLSFEDNKGKIIYLTTEEYNDYLTSKKVPLNANGGSCDKESITVYYNKAISGLPVPQRDYYTFVGWFTEKDGGKEYKNGDIYTDVKSITLYARWSPNEYTAKWNTGTGYTISVKRTSSPNADAATGNLSSGEAVYYGDVLSITYSAKTGYSIKTKGATSITVKGNVTASDIFATVSVNSYTANWSTGTGYTISVNRTASPNANAEIGDLSSGDAVYYGDVLSISYAAVSGYSIETQGATSITVKGNVTASDIFATATANEYTYTIVYKSSNGTVLATQEEVTYKYGTTNEISPKTFTGYTTPAVQSVAWDSTEAKTITFEYVPNSVGTKTLKNNAWWWKGNGETGIKYTVKVTFSDRTATSVKAKITWTNAITNAYYGFYTQFKMVIGNASTGNVRITENSTWASQTSSTRTATKTATITITGLSATQTSVSYTATPSAYPGAACPSAFSGTLTIPAY